MHMVVHSLVQNSAQNESINGEVEEALYVALKDARCTEEKHVKKDLFDITVDGPLDGANRGAPLNLKSGSLRILYILYSAEQTKLLTFSN